MHSEETKSPNNYPEYLLGKNQIPSEENVALFKAASAGSITGVENALKKGAKPNFFHRPDDGKNALHVTAENGSIDILRLLLDHGAVVDALAAPHQSTALIYACQNDHIEVVKVLLAAGANVNAVNCYGNSGLHEAARLGYVALLKLLIEAGAHVNLANHKGSTPMHFCCYGEASNENSIEVIKALLAAGSNINIMDHRNLTPLLVCCTSGK
jgi:ankyrin repeat protein